MLKHCSCLSFSLLIIIEFSCINLSPSHMYRLFVPSGSTSPLMYDWNCSSDKFRDSLFSFSTKSTTQHCKKVEAYNIRFSAHVTDNWDKKFHKVQNYLLMIFLNTDNQVYLCNFAFETSFSFYSMNWHHTLHDHGLFHCRHLSFSHLPFQTVF